MRIKIVSYKVQLLEKFKFLISLSNNLKIYGSTKLPACVKFYRNGEMVTFKSSIWEKEKIIKKG
jgi:hypothetical protein